MEIYLRKCTLNDFESFHFLRCDKENIYWTGYKNKPKRQELEKWFTQQLGREDRIIFLANNKFNDEVIGYLYLDIVAQKNDIIDIGYGVHSKYKSQGIGTKIIDFAIDYTKNNLRFISQMDAWILETNISSIKVILKNCFLKTDLTKSIFLESTNKKEVMRKYICKIER